MFQWGLWQCGNHLNSLLNSQNPPSKLTLGVHFLPFNRSQYGHVVCCAVERCVPLDENGRLSRPLWAVGRPAGQFRGELDSLGLRRLATTLTTPPLAGLGWLRPSAAGCGGSSSGIRMRKRWPVDRRYNASKRVTRSQV